MQKLGLTALAASLLMAAPDGTESMGFFGSSTSRRKRKEREFTEFDQQRMYAADAKRERKHPARFANFYEPPGNGGTGHAAKLEADPQSISSIKLKHRIHRGAARLIKALGGEAA